MPDEQPPDIGITELNFEKETLYKLYRSGLSKDINPLRWDRVRTEIRFEDVVADLTGHSGVSAIRCPFHGTDSRPSFYLYRGSNDGWCYGCTPKFQYYDQVRFVSRILDISRSAALRWLENKWELPPLEDEKDEDEEGDVFVKLSFEDLQEPYILKASRQVQQFKDVELAEEYLQHYFKAVSYIMTSEEAKKQGEIADALDFEARASMTLARIVDPDEIARIFARKELKGSNK